jgi:hypothetical protein
MGSSTGSGITAYNLQRAKDLLLEHLRSSPPQHQYGTDTANRWLQEGERLREAVRFAAIKAGLTIEQARQEVDTIRQQALAEDDSKKRELSRSMGGRLIEWKE